MIAPPPAVNFVKKEPRQVGLKKKLLSSVQNWVLSDNCSGAEFLADNKGLFGLSTVKLC